MDQSEILERFKQVAVTLGRIEPSQSDAILKLAQVTADASNRLTVDEMDKLVAIGAVLYQEALSQWGARSELDELMRGRSQLSTEE